MTLKQEDAARQDEGRYSGPAIKARMQTAAALFGFYIAMNLGVWVMLHFLSSADVATAVAAQTITPCAVEAISTQASHEE